MKYKATYFYCDNCNLEVHLIEGHNGFGGGFESDIPDNWIEYGGNHYCSQKCIVEYNDKKNKHKANTIKKGKSSRQERLGGDL